MGGCLRKLQGGASANDDKNQGKLPANKKYLDESDITPNNPNSKQANNKKEQPAPQQQQQQNADGKKQFSWEKRKKADLSNFQFMNEQDKLLFKLPGSLNGQQFRIQKCIESNIYVHDNHEQCFIDECINCVIVMGPSCSSTFIRQCKDCKIVITCQQLRLRDCHNLEIMIYSQTQPVIESSSNIKFICHQYGYPQLISQMKLAKMSIWNNKWNDVFDFTPNQMAQKGKNYSISLDIQPNFVSTLEQLQKIIKQIETKKGIKIESLKEIEDADLDAIDLDFDIEANSICIPHTLGIADQQFTQECLMLIFLQQSDQVQSDEALEVLHLLQDGILEEGSCWIQETRSTELSPEQIQELLECQQNSNKVQQKTKCMTIGIQVKTNRQSSNDFEKKMIQLFQKSKLKLNLNFKSQSVKQQANLFFKTYNIEHTGHNIKQ